jgi:uncharacterized protein YgiM (DUF1202 family)
MSFSQDEDLPTPRLTNPAGTVFCRVANGGVDGSFIRTVPRNDLINLRQGPGLNYPIIGNFEGGAGHVVARYQNWFQIQGYRDSPYTLGWFHGKYINVARMSASDRACLRIPRGFNPR